MGGGGGGGVPAQHHRQAADGTGTTMAQHSTACTTGTAGTAGTAGAAPDSGRVPVLEDGAVHGPVGCAVLEVSQLAPGDAGAALRRGKGQGRRERIGAGVRWRGGGAGAAGAPAALARPEASGALRIGGAAAEQAGQKQAEGEAHGCRHEPPHEAGGGDSAHVGADDEVAAGKVGGTVGMESRARGGGHSNVVRPVCGGVCED